jgi:hypothetical protein
MSDNQLDNAYLKDVLRELELERKENFRLIQSHNATYAVLSKRDSEHVKQITRLTRLHKGDKVRNERLRTILSQKPKVTQEQARKIGEIVWAISSSDNTLPNRATRTVEAILTILGLEMEGE